MVLASITNQQKRSKNTRIEISLSAPPTSKNFPATQPKNFARAKMQTNQKIFFLPVQRRWDYFVVIKTEEIKRQKITPGKHLT